MSKVSKCQFSLVLTAYSCFWSYVNLKLSSKIDESINTEYEIELVDTEVLGEPRR